MVWVSADYYRNQYNGRAVSEEDFPRLEAAAQRYLEQAVSGRVTDHRRAAAGEGCRMLSPSQAKAVRDGVCALIEALLLQEGSEGVRSETLGDYSVTYFQESGGKGVRMAQVVRQFLGGTGLLYRGKGWGKTLWVLPEEDWKTF